MDREKAYLRALERKGNKFMMELPTDVMMLFSVVNTKLRDNYASLDALCEDMHVNRRQLEARLKEAGFEYNPAQNKFW